MRSPRVVIIGGGFGGLNAAKALKNANVEILLIDRSNHHLFQPLLYQVASAAVSPGDIASPIRDILASQKNASVLLAEIVAVDKKYKQVVSENGERFSYDYLILSTGSRHSYFGHDEWEAFAPGLKTLNDAVNIRERVLLSYERAERCTDPALELKLMRFIIVGGGPTGVEMAGAIAEMAHKSLVENFRNIKPEQTEIYLIEGADQLIPSFPKELGEKAKKDLEKLGVEVLLSSFVTQITAEGLWVKDRFIESRNIIWAAGNEASSLLKTLDVPLDKSRRVIVKPDLSIPDYPDLFVIGDAAYSLDEDGQPLPGIAPVAIQQGRYVANLIKKQIPILERKEFKYFNKGMMATIG
ncbi:MAG: NAD(P)/FAD-dependent oxidoreductase, partial [Parachlamydiaceae bacterium]|nr:NAD(P)/FAD-dependent oxidoreductase [Parachlamydiaceae bacterium]